MADPRTEFTSSSSQLVEYDQTEIEDSDFALLFDPQTVHTELAQLLETCSQQPLLLTSTPHVEPGPDHDHQRPSDRFAVEQQLLQLPFAPTVPARHEILCIRIHPDASLPDRVRSTVSVFGFQCRPNYRTLLWPGRAVDIPTGLIIHVQVFYRLRIHASDFAHRSDLHVDDQWYPFDLREFTIRVRNLGSTVVSICPGVMVAEGFLERQEECIFKDVTQ